MAKKLRDEDLVLNIIVNGDKGRAEINELGRAITSFNKNLAVLEKERAELTKTGKQDTAEWRLNTEAINRNKDAIKMAEERMALLKKGIKLTDMSMTELSREQKRLTGLLRASVPGTENYMRYRRELEAVKARLTEVGVAQKQTTMSLGKMADGVNRYIGLAAAFTGSLSLGVMGARKASEAYAEYDDKLADVIKTTGLSKEAVEGLSDSLSEIDTRTAQLELLGLARQAGKLGISAKEDVEAFVVAADQIGVSLGEDLGDKEQAINAMGKLVDLFKVKDDYGMADGMIRVGSAVNALGAASTANEGYIVEFTQQVGGMAQQAGVSIQNILGLGATLDKFGQRTEASATVIGRVIAGMHKKTEDYAKVAKMSTGEFSKLLSKDANEAMLRVFENMAGGGMQKVVDLLGDLGEKGVRASQVLSTLAANSAELRAQQSLANDEFAKGTSVLNEYRTKNESAQAQLEKARKIAQERLVELGRTLQPLMSGMVSGFSSLIKAMSVAVKFFIEYKGILLAVTTATIAYVTYQKLKVFWSEVNRKAILKNVVALKVEDAALKKSATTIATYTLGQKALAAAKALLTLQFKAAGIAAKSFFASLGPIGWVITAITGIVTVMALLKDSTNEASGVYSEFGMALRKEDNTYEDLKKRLKETTEGTTERADLIKLINELYGDYLPGLLTERSTTEEIATALDNATGAMKRNIAERIRASETEKAEQVLYEAKRQAVNALLESYAESGDRTAGQMALAAQRFSAAIDLIDKTPTTGKERVAAVNTLLSAMGEKLIWSVADIQAAQISLFGNGGPIAQATDALTDYAASYEQYIKSTRTTNALFPNFLDEKKKEQIVVDKVCEKCGKNPCECYKVLEGDKKAWTLDSDQKFSEQRVALKRKQLAGEYATEEEFSRDLLNLEIATLEARIATNKDKGAELAKIQEQLIDKQLAKAKEVKKREEDLAKIAQGGDTELQKAQREYQERLRAAKLNAADVANMTATEKAALLQIEKEHADKISSINLKGLQGKLEKEKKALDKKLTVIRLAQAEELAAADTIVKKKILLEKWFSAEELREVKTAKEADKLLKSKYSEDEQAQTKEELTKILETYQAMASELEAKGSLMNGTVKLTEEDAAKLQEIIDKLRAELSKLGQDPKATIEKSKVDVLGMSADDWATMFKNTEGGLTSFNKMAIAAQAIGQALNEVSKLMDAIDQRDLKNYEKSQNKKKQALDRQLKGGAISQEAYNSKVQAIDEQTDIKRQEIERKQAERQKAMAIFSAISATAVAVAGALGSIPYGPWNIALAALVGAMGAVQIATIVAQPLPGVEQGGWVDVVREQDGRPFHARRADNKRGAVSEPTVIVGENGTEYVVPADGYRNPTVRPVLDIIEQARLRGQLGSINLDAVMRANTVPGRVSGGSISPTRRDDDPVPVAGAAYLDGEVVRVLTLVQQSVDKLNDRLNTPISAEVVMTGERGLAKQYDKFNTLRNRATIGRRP